MKAIKVAYAAMIAIAALALIIVHHKREFEGSAFTGVLAIVVFGLALWFPFSWVLRLVDRGFKIPKR